MKTKIKTWVPSIVTFMLLFPFRLPISVLLILSFNYIANLAGKVVPEDVMCANVVISKLVYDIIFGAWFTYSCEKMFIKMKGRRANEGMNMANSEQQYIYVWTVLIGILMIAYIIYDAVATYQMFYSIIGKPIPS